MNKLLYGLYLLFLGSLGFMFLEWFIRTNRPYTNLLEVTGQQLAPAPMATWAIGDAFSAFKPKPGKYRFSRGENLVAKTVNSHGLVSTPEITSQKPANTIRIAFFGESSTAGTGVNLPDEETWPFKTWQMLKLRFPEKNIEFLNAASGGYTSFESYGRFWSRIRFFEPDIIVVNHGWNDLSYFNRNFDLLKFKTDHEGGWDLARPRFKLELYQPHPIDPYIKWSQFLVLLRLKFARPYQKGEIHLKTTERKNNQGNPDTAATIYYPGAINIFQTNLMLFKKTSEVFKSRLFICKQPTLIVAGLPDSLQQKCQTGLHGFGFGEHLQAYQQLYQAIDQTVPPAQVIDLTLLSGQGNLFYDHVHPTPAGTTAYAREVSRALIPYLQQL